MRHLSLSLIAAAFLLAACDMNRPAVERTSSRQESFGTTTTQSDLGPEVRGDDVLTDGALIDDNMQIQAEEDMSVTPRADERKTYNEKQFSDDESDYPIDRADRGETYNENKTLIRLN